GFVPCPCDTRGDNALCHVTPGVTVPCPHCPHAEVPPHTPRCPLGATLRSRCHRGPAGLSLSRVPAVPRPPQDISLEEFDDEDLSEITDDCGIGLNYDSDHYEKDCLVLERGEQPHPVCTFQDDFQEFEMIDDNDDDDDEEEEEEEGNELEAPPSPSASPIPSPALEETQKHRPTSLNLTAPGTQVAFGDGLVAPDGRSSSEDSSPEADLQFSKKFLNVFVNSTSRSSSKWRRRDASRRVAASPGPGRVMLARRLPSVSCPSRSPYPVVVRRGMSRYVVGCRDMPWDFAICHGMSWMSRYVTACHAICHGTS
ncbi:C-Jun-amino-terminal kinase-interacting protein 2-like, partial [Cyanistes caeruleus]|uniref:C-Jun-amino-terminal kinase-interacting protein 2-like n=1 Tax=Cyanistes caeruleus TaxID=156563 RepID=UPI000CDB2C4B